MFDALKRLLGGGKEKEPEPTPGKRSTEILLPFEHVVVSGAEALAKREELAKRPGITAVVMGSPDDIGLIEDVMTDEVESVEELLADSLKVDLADWIARNTRDQGDYYTVAPSKWPEESQIAPIEFTVHLDTESKDPLPEVVIGLVPTANSWEAPAHVSYGGWNDCPIPEVHVAFHRHWNEQYGSAIVAMSDNAIQCTVERPPATREAAMALAREQFHYCPDLVHQGEESVEDLAATLMKSRVWYFWWD